MAQILAMVDVQLKSDHGDWDIVLIEDDIASSPVALARFVREWGEQHSARKVWFHVTGARSAATLDLTVHGAAPEVAGA